MPRVLDNLPEDSLARKNAGLVGWCIKRWLIKNRGGPFVLQDDLLQAAVIALWQASLKYDGRGRFSSYAVPCIMGSLYTEKAKQRIIKIPAPCQRYYGRHYARAYRLADLHTDDIAKYNDVKANDVFEDAVESRDEWNSIIGGFLNRLDYRSQFVFKARYGIGLGRPLTLTEISCLIGVTRERVRQIEAKVFRKLQGYAARRRYDRYREEGKS